jgi:hypothetical protein
MGCQGFIGRNPSTFPDKRYKRTRHKDKEVSGNGKNQFAMFSRQFATLCSANANCSLTSLPGADGKNL